MVKIGKRVVARWAMLALPAAGALCARQGRVATRAAPAAATSVPQVIGPIPTTSTPGDPSPGYVFYSTPMDLAKVGYEEQEYFIRGVANRYNTTTPNAAAPIG